MTNSHGNVVIFAQGCPTDIQFHLVSYPLLFELFCVFSFLALVEMLQKDCPEALNEEDDEELEIEINNIDGITLASLNAFAQKCADAAAQGGDKNKKQAPQK